MHKNCVLLQHQRREFKDDARLIARRTTKIEEFSRARDHRRYQYASDRAEVRWAHHLCTASQIIIRSIMIRPNQRSTIKTFGCGQTHCTGHRREPSHCGQSQSQSQTALRPNCTACQCAADGRRGRSASSLTGKGTDPARPGPARHAPARALSSTARAAEPSPLSCKSRMKSQASSTALSSRYKSARSATHADSHSSLRTLACEPSHSRHSIGRSIDSAEHRSTDHSGVQRTCCQRHMRACMQITGSGRISHVHCTDPVGHKQSERE